MKKFTHSRLFKVICGLVVVVIIFTIYNCIVSDDRMPSALTPEQEEQAEQERVAYKDTFDVVGDYLFPAQKHSADELMTDEERDGKNSREEKKVEQKVTTAADDEMADEIIESADISSDTKPAPPAPAPRDPMVEQLETPKVTPVE